MTVPTPAVSSAAPNRAVGRAIRTAPAKARAVATLCDRRSLAPKQRVPRCRLTPASGSSRLRRHRRRPPVSRDHGGAEGASGRARDGSPRVAAHREGWPPERP
eukprot:5233740-Prymnesium_polylepis.1